jgi:RNA polymerase sigma factor (sigma-70 family)
MAAGSETLVRYIRGLVIRPEQDEATDAALLGRFIADRDERAFAALVDRHGPLVLQVCRRVLGDVHDAEDAFQAAFLVLARKAATVRPRKALAAWLHGVAHRVARKSRSARVRRLRRAQPLSEQPPDRHPDPLAELSARELLAVVDEEVRRLPEVYRLPVILCCLEGRSQEEAARQLGLTPGSVRGRLERGRARLHARLLRRGLTLSAALAAAEVSRGSASAAAVARLVAATVQAAVLFAARSTTASGVSAEAAALAGDVIRGMALARLKVAAALLLATCLLATGLVIHRPAPSPREAAPQIWSSPFPPEDPAALAAPGIFARSQPAAPRDEADVPIDVSGRVLDPAGRPFAGATLYVGYSAHRYTPFITPDVPFRQPPYPPRATSGADGRFHFAFAQSELDARWLDDARPAVVAVAGGYGPDWAEVGEAGKGAELSLKLVEDLPVDGRILDANRQPVAGAKVLVRDVISDSEGGVTRFLRGETASWYARRWRGPLPGQPPGITTDADGRFRLTGLGRDRLVDLALEGPAVWHPLLQAVTRPSAATPLPSGVYGATFEYVASPARSIRGVVRDRATGKPLAGVKISARETNSTTLTDGDGRFEILGCLTSQQGYLVLAQPQTGQPYFAASAQVPEGAGPDPLTVDFDLVSGIPLSGRVTDQSTQKPPRMAVVEYYPLFPNPHSSKITNGFLAASSAVVHPDGSYRLVVLPGPGAVCVAASPRNSYAVARVDDKELATLVNDGINHDGGHNPLTAVGAGGQDILCVNKYNILSFIDPNETAGFLALDLTLQPARTLQGTVLGPDGEPLTGVRVVGLTAMPYDEMLESASFRVMGLNPRRTRELFFDHGGKNLGKVLTIQGDETRLLQVQLEPCGTVIGRLVDKAGKPVRGVQVGFYRPGDLYIRLNTATNADGRFRMEGLVPGAKYSLTSSRPPLKDLGWVEVESGRSIDLGDLPLAD